MDHLLHPDRLHHQITNTTVLRPRHQLHTLRHSTPRLVHLSLVTHLPPVLKSQLDHHRTKAMGNIMDQDLVADGAADAVAGMVVAVEEPTASPWGTVRHRS